MFEGNRVAWRAVGVALMLLLAPGAGAATHSIPGTKAQVAWPGQLAAPKGAAATVPGGTRLRLVITQRKRSAREVTARLVQLTPSRTTVRSKRLRRGVFAAVVPATTEARTFELDLRVGGKSVRRTRFTSTAAAPSTPAAPAPTPPQCGTGEQLAAHVADPSIAPSSYGVHLSFVVTNVGTACISRPTGTSIERLIDGTWSAVDAPPNPETTELTMVAPGASTVTGAWLHADAPTGRYRAVVTISRVSIAPVPPAHATIVHEFDYAP